MSTIAAFVAACRGCHGHNLAGGEDPNAPIGPNLAPGGRALDEEMPWMEYKGMSDDKLRALFACLKTLAALSTNGP